MSHQISYDLTGSLTRNKDFLPQNLLFTMKCKYPINNAHKSTLWPQCTLDHKDALLSKLTRHKPALCQHAVVFLCVCVCARACFIPYVADSTVCVYIVYRRCQMWLVAVRATQTVVVWVPEQPCVQQPNCYNFHDEANLLKTSPSLTLGCSPSLPFIHVHWHTYSVLSSSLAKTWKLIGGQGDLCKSIVRRWQWLL